MGNNNSKIFNRLKRIFSSNVIVSLSKLKKIKTYDDMNSQVSFGSIPDKYTRLYNGSRSMNNSLSSNGYEGMKNTLFQRIEYFKDYELMDGKDPIIASALDVYADESTLKSEYGDILTITSNDDDVKESLENLFYDILNIEFNLWSWIRNLCKYGDFFLKLEISEKFGIVNCFPLSPYEIKREEITDENGKQYIRFIYEGGGTIMNNQDKYLENYEIGHFRLLSDTNFAPYGKSMIESARTVWKSLNLMEDAMLIHRIMRAPEKRIFKIDIGNIPLNEVDQFMQSTIDKMKKVPFVDPNTGEYNLKYNMMNIVEDYYLPVRGSDSGTAIEPVSGMEWSAIDDVTYLRDKLLSALKIPKAFLGYEGDLNSKSTLSQQDLRFARTIERIQKIVESELLKIAHVHLLVLGYDEDKIAAVDLSLTSPSTIYEQEKIELLQSKVNLAQSAIDTKLFDNNWIYENIFNITEKTRKSISDGIVKDLKLRYRYSQIETDGNDPKKSGQAVVNGGGKDARQFRKYNTEDDIIDFGDNNFSHPLGTTDIYDRDDSNMNLDKTTGRKFKGGSPLNSESKQSLINNMKLSKLIK